MLLTKHEGETFQNQTVYISGQAFIRCAFVGCTLVLRETVYHMEECSFSRCNWHVDCVLLWGSPDSVQQIKALIGILEQGQQQVQEQMQTKQSAGQSAQEQDVKPTAPTANPSPFA